MKQPVNNHLQKLVKKYLDDKLIMQLATVRDGKPWICTVHFASDDDFNIFWLSAPTRRHSVDIAEDPRVAVTVVAKGPEHPVVGVQMEGRAELVEPADIEKAIEIYGSKHGLKPQTREKIKSGSSTFKFYKFTPEFGVLFSEADFPDEPSQVWLSAGDS